MDTWLGPGVEPLEVDRRPLLSRLGDCSIITSDADGALSSRTARIEQVSPNGGTLTIRLLGSNVYHDVIPNPRVVLSARPAIGPHALIVVNGLARIHSRQAAGGTCELLVLEVSIQRIECWGDAPLIPVPRAATLPVEERQSQRHDARHDPRALRRA